MGSEDEPDSAGLIDRAYDGFGGGGGYGGGVKKYKAGGHSHIYVYPAAGGGGGGGGEGLMEKFLLKMEGMLDKFSYK